MGTDDGTIRFRYAANASDRARRPYGKSDKQAMLIPHGGLIDPSASLSLRSG